MHPSTLITLSAVSLVLLVSLASPVRGGTSLRASFGDAPKATDFIRASSTLGDRHFYDESGRVRIFHGVNRTWKAKPWYYQEQIDSDDEMRIMQSAGLNVVRLGYMWSGVNPEEGVFNQTYVDTIKTIVKKMENHGVYVLLDMHQDILSSKFCLYDGAPQWVIAKSTPKHAFPWPLKGDNCDRNWEMNAISEAAATAYQNIYDNHNGMLDDLVAFWTYTAEQFRDIPNVIGYEIMNEPFAGNFYEDPSLLLPGIAGSKNLARMNDAVAAGIRKHDNQHIIFYEPVTWGMVFDSKIAGTGFTHVPGGDEYRHLSALSFHYYCNTFLPGYDKKTVARKVVCDAVTGPLVFEAIKKDLAHLGGASMLTEGMACNDPNTWSKGGECHRVTQLMDKGLFSWTDYAAAQSATWKPSPSLLEGWARTYARAVAGQPLELAFEHDTKEFSFCYSVDTAIEAHTELYASLTYSYANGRAVRITDNIRVVPDPSGVETDLILLEPTADAKPGDKACVWITKAA